MDNGKYGCLHYQILLDDRQETLRIPGHSAYDVLPEMHRAAVSHRMRHAHLDVLGGADLERLCSGGR